MANNMYMIRHVVCPNCGEYMSFFGIIYTKNEIIIMFVCSCTNTIKVSINISHKEG